MRLKFSQLYYFLLSLFFISIFTFNNATAGDIKGKVHISGKKSNEDALVYIEHVDGTFLPPKKSPVMNQKDLMFIPMVLPILAGSTVNFLNNDDVLHNVFTPSKCAGRFNLGTWPEGEIRSHTFDDPGCIVTILCNVHPDMQAWIVVLQNPYFAKTDGNGNFEIKNVPQGTYVLKVWYPFYNSKSIKVVIKDSGNLQEDIVLLKK
ncbi:MAG: beta-sandwich domain-containing protein [Ignavibacteriaceae bacterium]